VQDAAIKRERGKREKVDRLESGVHPNHKRIRVASAVEGRHRYDFACSAVVIRNGDLVLQVEILSDDAALEEYLKLSFIGEGGFAVH
jgi:hypothetical protein